MNPGQYGFPIDNELVRRGSTKLVKTISQSFAVNVLQALAFDPPPYEPVLGRKTVWDELGIWDPSMFLDRVRIRQSGRYRFNASMSESGPNINAQRWIEIDRYAQDGTQIMTVGRQGGHVYISGTGALSVSCVAWFNAGDYATASFVFGGGGGTDFISTASFSILAL